MFVSHQAKAWDEQSIRIDENNKKRRIAVLRQTSVGRALCDMMHAIKVGLILHNSKEQRVSR